ncbi:MAG: ABC transporter ATP-binding protein [Solirubrobacterales bacterium]
MHLECRELVVSPGGSPVLRGLDLRIAQGTLTALVGPSGAGKTTLLRVIAGLERIVQGEIWLGQRRIDTLAPHRRRCAVVFQEPRLLPHLDIVDNVAFALRAARMAKAQRRRRAQELLGEVGLGGLQGRGIDGLSGGEMQRVALARALCADPSLLMLDEPLAALDPGRREGLRRLIARVQSERSITTLLITHDRHEAAELGDHVALMLEGRIVQDDEPQALFQRPATPTAARFFGANLLRGYVREGRLAVGRDELLVPGPDGEAVVAVRPEHVYLDDSGPLGLSVVSAVYAGTHVRVALRTDDLTLEMLCDPRDAPTVGGEVRVSMRIEDLWRLPAPDAVVGPA